MTGMILCRDMNGQHGASVLSNPLSERWRKKERISSGRDRKREQIQVLTVFVTDCASAIYDAVTSTSSSSLVFSGPTTNTGTNMYVTSQTTSPVVIEKECRTGSPTGSATHSQIPRRNISATKQKEAVVILVSASTETFTIRRMRPHSADFNYGDEYRKICTRQDKLH